VVYWFHKAKECGKHEKNGYVHGFDGNFGGCNWHRGLRSAGNRAGRGGGDRVIHKRVIHSATTTHRTTTAAPAPQTQATQAPKPAYTEADYAEIIAAVRAYAESKTTVKFIHNPALTYEYANSGMAGYHDVSYALSIKGKRGLNRKKARCSSSYTPDEKRNILSVKRSQ
jgi:hypothetical protein